MAEFDINIDYNALRETYSQIENDINELEAILTNTYSATNTLDAKKWTSGEKQKMDSEYIPYLKKVSEAAPLALRNQLALARYALEKYENLEIHHINETKKLIDGSSIGNVEG